MNFSREDLIVGSIIALRGIGYTAYLIKGLKLGILIIDLHGILLFESEESLETVLNIAISSGINISKIS